MPTITPPPPEEFEQGWDSISFESETVTNLPSNFTETTTLPGKLIPIPSPQELNDDWNSTALVTLYGDLMRFVAPWGWLLWDGRRWERDRNGKAILFAKRTARHLFKLAAETPSDAHARTLGGWASKSLNRQRLDAMLYLARSEITAEPEAFDSDPRIFNTDNFTLELDTGNPRPHDQRDLLTKLAGCEYNPDALCPTWDAFLMRVLDNDQGMIEFIQRAAGYTLTGHTGEQCLFFLWGSGANGKSTMLTALLDVMGEYGRQAAPALLLQGRRHPTEIADLQGARMVATVEVEEGRRMAEVLVKQITGGDRIKARFMHSDFFEFTPSFKIWLAANHKPDVRGTDYAIWRRIHLIPFSVTIPEAERDPSLGQKLRGELPGILAWMVRGALDWQTQGLSIPQKVRDATAEYRAESDSIGQFISERCTISPEAYVFAGELYANFKAWSIENGIDPGNQVIFSRRMAERGFKSQRSGIGKKRYDGIGILSTDELRFLEAE